MRFRVTVRKLNVTDRQMDGQTDRQTDTQTHRRGRNISRPGPSARREIIIIYYFPPPTRKSFIYLYHTYMFPDLRDIFQ